MVVSSSTCDVTHAGCLAWFPYADLGCCAAGSLHTPLGQTIAVRSKPGVTGSPAASRPREWYQLLCLTAFAKLKHALVESPRNRQMDLSDVCCANGQSTARGCCVNGGCRPEDLNARQGYVPDAYGNLLTAISTAVLPMK